MSDLLLFYRIRVNLGNEVAGYATNPIGRFTLEKPKSH
jgi:hypothetical protein